MIYRRFFMSGKSCRGRQTGSSSSLALLPTGSSFPRWGMMRSGAAPGGTIRAPVQVPGEREAAVRTERLGGMNRPHFNRKERSCIHTWGKRSAAVRPRPAAASPLEPPALPGKQEAALRRRFLLHRLPLRELLVPGFLILDLLVLDLLMFGLLLLLELGGLLIPDGDVQPGPPCG